MPHWGVHLRRTADAVARTRRLQGQGGFQVSGFRMSGRATPGKGETIEHG